jgi:hypothetical protein
VPALMPGAGSEDENGVPAPQMSGALGRARAIANRAFAETVMAETNGHGNGHGPADEHAAVGAGHGELPSGGDDGEEPPAS